MHNAPEGVKKTTCQKWINAPEGVKKPASTNFVKAQGLNKFHQPKAMLPNLSNSQRATVFLKSKWQPRLGLPSQASVSSLNKDRHKGDDQLGQPMFTKI